MDAPSKGQMFTDAEAKCKASVLVHCLCCDRPQVHGYSPVCIFLQLHLNLLKFTRHFIPLCLQLCVVHLLFHELRLEFLRDFLYNLYQCMGNGVNLQDVMAVQLLHPVLMPKRLLHVMKRECSSIRP
jgi:hypothetical protein